MDRLFLLDAYALIYRSYYAFLKNPRINFAQGLQGAPRAYLTIDGVRNRSYETKVAKNSSGELKIYCEADLIQ